MRGDDNWPPYEMVEGGFLTGFHVELIRTVAKRIDVKIEFQTVPWLRAMHMVKLGHADAITYVAKNTERLEFIQFDKYNALSGADHYLIKRKDSPEVNFSGEIKNLAPYSIAHISGYTFGDEFDSAKFIEKTSVKTPEQVIHLVSKDWCDLGVISPVDIEDFESNKLMNNIEVIEPALYSSTVYLGFAKRKADQALIDKFTAEMKAFKATSEYQALRGKYKL